VLWHRGRAREAASLLGAVETFQRSSHRTEWFGARLDAVDAGVAAAGLDGQRFAGRELSLERAADLALRVLDEELAAASAAEGREGGGAAASADTPRRQGPRRRPRGCRLASGRRTGPNPDGRLAPGAMLRREDGGRLEGRQRPLVRQRSTFGNISAHSN
jgi:hypothetical protein